MCVDMRLDQGCLALPKRLWAMLNRADSGLYQRRSLGFRWLGNRQLLLHTPFRNELV